VATDATRRDLLREHPDLLATHCGCDVGCARRRAKSLDELLRHLTGWSLWDSREESEQRYLCVAPRGPILRPEWTGPTPGSAVARAVVALAEGGGG